MDHSTTEVTRQRLNQVVTESQPPQKVQQTTEAQTGSVAPPSHVPPQVLRKLVGRVPNSALQSLVGASGGPVPEKAEQDIQREMGGGQPLQAATQAQMGSAMGTDLAGVRVHNDDTSDHLAGQLGARAFAVGSDVFFAANEYQPATTDGQRVIAHELAHVMQDSDQPQAKLQVGSVDDPAEAEADVMAQRVVETISPVNVPEEEVQALRREPEEEEEALPLRREVNPEEEEALPLRREVNPEEEEALPLRRETNPEEEEALPLRRKV
ncbi:MAG: eCIS core domain-containing protein [Anaerolineae bacterium]